MNSYILPAEVTTTIFSLTASSTTSFKTSILIAIKGTAITDLRPVFFALLTTYCIAFTKFATFEDNRHVSKLIL